MNSESVIDASDMRGNDVDRLEKMVKELRSSGMLGALPLVCDAPIQNCQMIAITVAGHGRKFYSGCAHVGYVTAIIGGHGVIVVPRGDANSLTLSELNGDKLRPLIRCKPVNYEGTP